MINKSNRTPSSDIGHALYLYFLGLSIRGVAKAMFFLHKVKRSHVLLAKKWKWIQKCYPTKISLKRKKIEEYIMDEILIKLPIQYAEISLPSSASQLNI